VNNEEQLTTAIRCEKLDGGGGWWQWLWLWFEKKPGRHGHGDYRYVVFDSNGGFVVSRCPRLLGIWLSGAWFFNGGYITMSIAWCLVIYYHFRYFTSIFLEGNVH